ncbi:hypothetical protein PUN28_018056 [Cardiocondyla obscurior]|uniref:Uncharacterized protein n=1 Tax=Cardiocondyla obscurior TaxID=286306 RepID=A0AAW2EJH2_9HYME
MGGPGIPDISSQSHANICLADGAATDFTRLRVSLFPPRACTFSHGYFRICKRINGDHYLHSRGRRCSRNANDPAAKRECEASCH